jgi:hypothetical protein
MRFLATAFIVLSFSSFAQTESPKVKSEGAVETMVKSAKKDRKKKVEMCHECGKPEAQCDCKGEEHKKKD